MLKIAKRTLIAGAALMAGGAWPKETWAADDPKFAALYATARTQGEVTWYIAHISSEEAEHIGQLFTAQYPGVKVNIVRATGQVIYQKLSQDLRAQARNCDVFSSTDLGQYVSLSRRKLLLPYTPIENATLRPQFRDYDKTHEYQVTNTNFTTLVYQSPRVTAEMAPRRWADLLDPKWRGQVAMAHPAYSGAMGTWVYTIDKMYGWQFFEKLALNKPQIGRSLIDPVITIASGERLVGVGPADLILDQAARGNPVTISYPSDGSILMVGPTSIMRNAPHPDAAALFVEWLLGPQVSEYSATRHRLPVSAAVPPREGVKAPEEIKVIEVAGADLEKGIPAVIEKWRDTFGV
jgi:iron(III) transport system substrate-binding protein